MKKILVKLSIPFLMVEFWFVMVPLSLLSLVNVWSTYDMRYIHYTFYSLMPICVSVLFLISLVCTIILTIKVLFYCNENILKKKFLWLFLIIGVLLVIISFGSLILPTSEPDSDMAMYRDHLEIYSFCAPLTIYSIHLRYEALTCRQIA